MRHLIVMVRDPVPGRVKTRLQTRYSPEQASEIYAAFVRDVCDTARTLPIDKRIITYDPPGAERAVQTLCGEDWHYVPQAQADLGDWRLTDCDLYVTKEPCPMCAGAVVHCRLQRVIYGCPDEKGGAAGGGFINLLQQPSLNHSALVTGGLLEEDSRRLLRTFFQEARNKTRTSGAN